MAAVIRVNGKNYSVNLLQFPPDMTVNTFLREYAQLTATKNMCLEGGCGVCVVTVKRRHPVTAEVQTYAVNSCLLLLNTCTDCEITTCEGLGNNRSGYHPIQKRLAKLNGSQCGYCSPGMVMNMHGLLQSKNQNVTMREVENSFGGNICRCTGYRPILDAMKSFATDNTLEKTFEFLDIEDLGKGCPKLKNDCVSLPSNAFTSLGYEAGAIWYWPSTLSELFQVFDRVGSQEYMLVGGNTAHGVYRRSFTMQNFIDINRIQELKSNSITSSKLSLGANLTLSETMDIFLKAAKTAGFEYCQQLWNHFDLIANTPKRNMATIAGNISIKKQHPEFPSDIFITFEALAVKVVVAENASTRRIMSLADYLAYNLNKHAIVSFELQPYPSPKFLFRSYKIMPRAQNAHAYVNGAFLMEFQPSSTVVKSARICFGGIRPDYAHASSLETLLVGKDLYSKETVTQIFTNLSRSITPDAVLPDASPEYRLHLACSLFYKFLLSNAPTDRVKTEFKSGGPILQRPLSSGLQTYETIEKNYPVTQPMQKVEAMIQCAGEATYMNDILTPKDAVFCALVTAKKVGATIERIDASAALAIPGVIAFYSAKDIPGKNSFTEPLVKPLKYDFEEVFCSGLVLYYDQPYGVIVAETSDIAYYAADKVQAFYSKASTVLCTSISDVLRMEETDRLHTTIKSPAQILQLSDTPDVKASGIIQLGGQYHFTMEPQTTIVKPFEQGLKVWSATQCTDHTQGAIAKMLNIKVADVQLEVPRVGGGFGAKISRGNLIACVTALVAWLLNRPARGVQRIESMMSTLGKRWPCIAEYEIHAKSNGKIVGLKNNFVTDAGWSLNESSYELFTFDIFKAVYQFTETNLVLKGQAAITDAPCNAFMRAPGTLEGHAMVEIIIERIAFETQQDPADVRLVNLKPGDDLNTILPRFLASTEYRQRRREIDEYNEKNRYVKRGLGLSIMKYPISFFCQFPATVAIYHADGSVVISHGGVEMGQGMNTKATQVAAYTLGIPVSLVKIEASDTINGANACLTGGSITTESISYTVFKACEVLNERLKPARATAGANATWPEIVQAAYNQSIDLIVSTNTKEFELPAYNLNGLALTEVKVDILTGNLLISRVDILQDAGESINPFIDIGQIEGAFVMGLGYWLTEHLVNDRQTGKLLTNRTWNYKTPGAKDIPVDYRIELLPNSQSPTYLRSKVVGEPPICSSVSVIFAIHHAIQSARKDAGLKREWVRYGAPTTPETIALSAGSDIRNYSLK